MNAVLEIEPRAGAARRRQVVEMDEALQTQVARLESDVKHIMTDVADIKVEVRRTNDRLEDTKKTLNEKIDDVRETLTSKIDDVRESLTSKIDGVREMLTSKIGDVNKKIDDVRESLTNKIGDLNEKIDGVREDLTNKIDALAKELASAKIWAIGLYVAQSSTLLFVMAKGFKWL